MVSLASLVSRLQSDVAARNGTPSTDQYQAAIKDALASYSALSPTKKIATIPVRSGVASYSLPDDFQRLVQLTANYTQMFGTNAIISAAGIIPLNASFKDERRTIRGRTITFSPVPAYNLDRDLEYLAGYVLDDDNNYDLDESQVGVALLKAQAICFRHLAGVAAGQAWNYTIGELTVNKTNLSKALNDHAAGLEAQYLAALKPSGRQSTPVGMRGYP
jgi:hypothetical protein